MSEEKGVVTVERVKPFSLKAEIPPDYEIAPQLRQKVRRDPLLSAGAKTLYDHLSDASFLRKLSPARGIVEQTKPQIAIELGTSARTVARWAQELIERRYLWTTTVPFGTFELTRWFLREMADEHTEFWRSGDPRFRTSQERKRQRHTFRGSAGQFCPAKPSSGDKSTESTDLSGVTRQTCPPSPDNSDRHSAPEVTGTAGQSRPSDSDNSDRKPATNLTAYTGQNCPADASDLTESPDKSGRALENPDVKGSRDVSFKRSTVFNASKTDEEKRQSSKEKVFLLDVRAAMDRWRKGHGQTELDNSGVLYRYAYRIDPDLARRVLEELENAVKEQRVKENPGAFYVCTWKHWKGGPINEKTAAAAMTRRAAK